MVKDGRDSIKRSMRPCFHNGPSRSAILREKERKVFEKRNKNFHGIEFCLDFEFKDE